MLLRSAGSCRSCRKRRRPGRIYRLPTEAEWEFACRAGTTTAYHFGNSLSSEQANFGNKLKRTTTVDSYPPNGFGLYDMHGNVNQWCQDWYGDYPHAKVVDPQGPQSGRERVLRGGSWVSIPHLCRSAHRTRSEPGNCYYNNGLRVCFCLD